MQEMWDWIMQQANIFFFVDSDDFIARGTIKSLFDRLVQTNTDMAMCNIQYVDEHGKAMSKQDFFRDFQIKNNV